MGEVWFNGVAIQVKDLGDFLARVPTPVGVVAIDCETSGLYVDGDWNTQPAKCQPPARVSSVGMAWRDHTRVYTLGIPFDQGWVPGKPGKALTDDSGVPTGAFESLSARCGWVPKPTKSKPNPQPCGKQSNDRCHTTNRNRHTYEGVAEDLSHNFGVRDWNALMRWLHGKPLTNQNMKFDLHMLSAGLRETLCCGVPSHDVPTGWEQLERDPCVGRGRDFSEQVVSDTMLVQGYLEPLNSSALKPTAARLWGFDEAEEAEALKPHLKANGTGLTKRYDLVAWRDMRKYVVKDAELALRLHEDQRNRESAGMLEPCDRDNLAVELEVMKTLFRMEQRGAPFDAQAMAAACKTMTEEVARLEAELPFKPPTITAAKEWFYTVQGASPYKVTPTGEPSLDKECVAKLIDQGVEGADTWQQLADINSCIAKWFKRWPNLVGPDGRIRTNFNQGRIESDRSDKRSGGAISGRLSASRVQAQGVPRELTLPPSVPHVKKFFVPEPGFTIVEVDVSNAEIRVAAWLSQCKTLADRCNSGENIHDSNTIEIFGVDKGHPKWDMYRGLSKIGVFSDLYGSGVDTMVKQFEQGLKQSFKREVAQDFKEKLNAAYPELKRTARAAQNKADRTRGGCGFVRLVNGRKRWFGWGERTHKAFNAAIQGGVAEVMKRFMVEVDRNWSGALINQVHDSLWLELDSGSAMCIANDVKALGERMFSEAFSTPAVPLQFTLDVKVLSVGGECESVLGV